VVMVVIEMVPIVVMVIVEVVDVVFGAVALMVVVLS